MVGNQHAESLRKLVGGVARDGAGRGARLQRHDVRLGGGLCPGADPASGAEGLCPPRASGGCHLPSCLRNQNVKIQACEDDMQECVSTHLYCVNV